MVSLEKSSRAPDFGSINTVLSEMAENEKGRIFLTWSFIRNFGELQVLTRASYVMLLIVPLLAGLWPSVKIVVNRYNDTLTSAQERIQILLAHFQTQTQIQTQSPSDTTADQDNLQTVITSLDGELNQFSQMLDTAAIQTSTLPLVWVLSFFASLFAIIAQTIHQASAPQIVRQNERREYIGKILEEETRFLAQGAELNEEGKRDLIIETNEQYENAAHTNRSACRASLAGYMLALALICWIIVDQTLSVLRAAGW